MLPSAPLSYIRFPRGARGGVGDAAGSILLRMVTVRLLSIGAAGSTSMSINVGNAGMLSKSERAYVRIPGATRGGVGVEGWSRSLRMATLRFVWIGTVSAALACVAEASTLAGTVGGLFPLGITAMPPLLAAVDFLFL